MGDTHRISGNFRNCTVSILSTANDNIYLSSMATPQVVSVLISLISDTSPIRGLHIKRIFGLGS